MGYTHYWENPKGFSATQWEKFTKKVREILRKNTIPLEGPWEGEPAPLIDGSQVGFNGVGDDGHETLHIERRGTEFSFCKTARKPYDGVVVEVLKAARKANPNVKLSSDGGDEVFG